MGRLAIKVRDTNDDDLQDTHGKATKQCSGCDPDVPGHVERVFCKRCGGTGQEPLSFCSAFAQLAESRRAASDRSKGHGQGMTDEGPEEQFPDDDALYLEY